MQKFEGLGQIAMASISEQHHRPVPKLFRQGLSDDSLIFLSTRKYTEDIPYHIVT
ncbi:hypothetical protein LCG56_05705 [Pseudomonas cannabina pv. alisalensis]|uniref:hypothetical protein n=1 Tax=Pseudomonas syringae group TaxID=136849 RepID=UPI0018658AC6|nr:MULTISPECIES: hypothetical protein [Pseudomonas syringae group]UBY98622.1 hypothetical protein LCG56_05705 [Pseudomonas cannabina pv. alisalensis]